jgi:hypothetical protein
MLASRTASWYAATVRARCRSVSTSFVRSTSARDTSPNALAAAASYWIVACSHWARTAS